MSTSGCGLLAAPCTAVPAGSLPGKQTAAAHLAWADAAMLGGTEREWHLLAMDTFVNDAGGGELMIN